jgi:hypothetical protein
LTASEHSRYSIEIWKRTKLTLLVHTSDAYGMALPQSDQLNEGDSTATELGHTLERWLAQQRKDHPWNAGNYVVSHDLKVPEQIEESCDNWSLIVNYDEEEERSLDVESKGS